MVTIKPISKEIQTFGGLDKRLDFDSFGILFVEDDITIDLTSEQAILLIRVLKEHLEANGINI